MRLVIFFVLMSIGAYAQNAVLNEGSEPIQFKTLFDRTSQSGAACFRIPALITAPNGDLIAAVDERVPTCDDLRGNKNINIVIRRSEDNGNTWFAIETVVDYPLGQSASDPSMIVDRTTGAIFLFFNYMDLDNENGVYHLKVVRSRDNGKTWSIPADITSQITRPEWRRDFKFITSGRGIQTTGGELLHTLVNMDKGVFVFASDNHGETWHLIDRPVKPADESKLVELADGSWMINSRVNGVGLRYVHTSTDEGKTWQTQPDSSLIDPGCNASIIRCPSAIGGADKKLLLFSNVSSKDERKNLTIRLSYDEGKSWVQQKTIDAGSAAYSSLTILDTGDIGLLYEKDNYEKIVFTRFSLEWLIDGKDRTPKSNKR